MLKTSRVVAAAVAGSALLLGGFLALSSPAGATTSVSLSVDDAGTNAPWTGTETTGASAYATASIGGDASESPSGTVVYSFFDGATCSGSALETDSVTLGGTGTTAAPSTTVGALDAGDYSFQAAYSGDTNYAGGAACTTFSVGIAGPSLSTAVVVANTSTPWGSFEPLGTSAQDTAVLTGDDGIAATGTVTYNYYANPFCTGTPVSDEVTLAAGAVPNSSSTTSLSDPHAYSYQALYSGDPNYSAASGPCDAFYVDFNVIIPSPLLVSTIYDGGTNAPWGNQEVTGATAFDAATFSGVTFEVAVTGTVSFSLFSNSDCSGSTFQSIGTVDVDNGANSFTVSSPTSDALSAGTYSFLAQYSGNGNLAYTAQDVCQTFSVGRATPSTPFVANLPTTGIPGGGFTAVVNTTGDGIKSVTSNSAGTCTVSADGLTVFFVAQGTCSLTAHVAQGANYDSAVGTPQTLSISASSPSTNVLYPSSGASVSGRSSLVDASAVNAAAVQVFLVGGSYGLSGDAICAATPTLYGWLCDWDTTTAANGNYLLQSMATNTNGSTRSAFVAITVDNPAPSTSVVIPSDGTAIAGNPSLDAAASPGVTKVQYEITGGSYNHVTVATAAPTIYGWLASWNTTAFPNGAYAVQSVASYAGGVSGTSAPINVTVNNAGPSTAVVVPSNTASLSGTTQHLDASASSGVAQVVYQVSGGPSDLNDVKIATASPTIYGWLATWNTTTVPDGAYTLQSVASYAGGVSGTSPGISITVSN
jgi:large repetitive protein